MDSIEQRIFDFLDSNLSIKLEYKGYGEIEVSIFLRNPQTGEKIYIDSSEIQIPYQHNIDD